MATFSQFKSKYITEVKKPLYGDSLNKNIVKKVVTDPIKNIEKKQRIVDKRIESDASASSGDGGKKAMQKFEKELGLNDTDTKGRNIKKKQVQLNKTSNQNISLRGEVDQRKMLVKRAQRILSRNFLDKTLLQKMVERQVREELRKS